MKQSLAPFLNGKKHIIWDWNGTLLNDVDLAVSAVCRLLRTHQLPEISREAYLEVFSFPVAKYYERLGFDFEKTPFAHLSEQFIANYDDGFPECALHSGVEALLAEFKASGMTQSILSAAQEKALHKQLAAHGISGYFERMYGLSDHSAESKVHRGRRLIADVGLPQEVTILIGDTDHDLEVGRELGIDVVLFCDGHQSRRRLASVHHAVVERGQR